jgi:Tubulin C-terminal domain
VAFSDVSRNIDKMKKKLDFISWNSEGFKYGICGVPSVNYNKSLLCLANNAGITEIFGSMSQRFNKLYLRQVYLHHYTNFIEKSMFEEARENLEGIIKSYQEINYDKDADKEVYRYSPLI